MARLLSDAQPQHLRVLGKHPEPARGKREAITHWVVIADICPGLCPSLLGLAAGVHVHHCERRERQAGPI
ncbi:hypothetical protein FQA47_010342 [Oryzias melastigma]|uniref:Uncharacterized protein n=1 Tax=Oryzias melastigma TaxID=30732 RepID=A0A834F6L5_ORYME|nr:hypothetical protein FQA47_010342 [Oryzias melastigma]